MDCTVYDFMSAVSVRHPLRELNIFSHSNRICIKFYDLNLNFLTFGFSSLEELEILLNSQIDFTLAFMEKNKEEFRIINKISRRFYFDRISLLNSVLTFNIKRGTSFIKYNSNKLFSCDLYTDVEDLSKVTDEDLDQMIELLVSG